jgi:hypothetical protein
MRLKTFRRQSDSRPRSWTRAFGSYWRTPSKKLEHADGVTYRKGLIAAEAFKKGELVMAPYTNVIAFVPTDSITAQALTRDDKSTVYIASGDCVVGAVELTCFLKAPLMYKADEEETEERDWDKHVFQIPYGIVTRSQQTTDTQAVNLTHTVVKHNGINIPVLKNTKPINKGDGLFIAAKKRTIEHSTTDAIPQDEDDAADDAGAAIGGKGKGRKGRGRRGR